MARKLNEIQQKELSFIKDWCLTIIHFLLEKYGLDVVLKMFEEVVVKSYNEQNLRGSRYLIKDINEFAKELPENDLNELNLLLNKTFGKDLLKDDDKIAKKIIQILKKGKITTEAQFRLVLGRVEQIYQNPDSLEEVERLNKLLSEFETARNKL
ncbi:hypothetical protein [Mucilaginibacter auburnensis]|uniref:Uncharacterized protein n=1 Tax=Mucilaginibacter auburnensis TaxID=1457233 RepID=A0A2H9VPN4_9SPHI|nr:hypothetical protein [Mucilaginibacter auburnensis]PJJ80287.1 hypothetical protein CLV57_3437 [Mucilaginibacter auburnensis]